MKVPTAGLVFLEASALLTAARRVRGSKMQSNSLSYYTLRIECTLSSCRCILKGFSILSAPTLA